MQIGFDITSLYVAQAGVFYYRYNQIKAMLALNSPAHQFLLLDYFPVHGGWRTPPEIETLTSPHAELRHVRGIRQRKLSRLHLVHKLGIRPFAKMIDETLFAPWARWEAQDKERQLQKNLASLDIFHTSDVLQYAAPHIKTVTTIYDMTTLLFPEMHTVETREMQQKKYRFAQEKADAVIAISQSARQDVINLLGIEPERVHVVYAGVDPSFRPLSDEEIAPHLAKFNLQVDSYILTVGTIEPRKNLVRLIQAYHAVWQKQPKSMPKLVLAGATGWFFREVFALVKNLGLSKQVLFIGRVDDADLPALYNGALFLAYPTLYEGFGMPALEAMACKTAVLTSNTSSLPEVVGNAGLLIEPTDVDSIMYGLQQLIEDNPYRRKLSQMGLQRATKFAWENAAKETLQLYMSI